MRTRGSALLFLAAALMPACSTKKGSETADAAATSDASSSPQNDGSPAPAADGATSDSAREGGSGQEAGGCAQAKFCDDFEAYAEAGPFTPWKTSTTGGSVKVDTIHAYSGKKSAHIHADPGDSHRAQLVRRGAPAFPADGNAFWGRMMVFATHLPGKSDIEDKNVHFDVIQADGTPAGQYRIAGMGNFLLNYEPHDCYFGTNKVIPQNKWACWEWLFDGATNTIDFYVDGQLQAHLKDMGQGCVDGTKSVWAAPKFENLLLGWINYQSMAETVDMWLDDVAVGGKRIGCAAPSATDAPH